MHTRRANLRARALRRAATPPEMRRWSVLGTLRAAGHHVRRQAPFGADVLDFVSCRDRLVIEVDGARYGTVAHIANDAGRGAVPAAEGFATLRFRAADVLAKLEGVAITIRKAVGASKAAD